VRGKIQSPANPITQVVPGAGIHEIIIESPQHLVSITELDDGQVAAILEVYRGRLAALRQMKKFHSALVFKNGGPTAGATLVHVHSQLIAIENRQPVFADRLPQFQNHAQQFGNCPLCQMLDEVSSALPHPVGNRSVEPSEGNRLVAATPNFLAFCPFAARLAYEAWIIPRQHSAHFDAVAPESLPELAGLLRTVLVKLERIVKLPAYNYLVHTAPFDTFGSDHYHWHIEILPRTTALAGFELGTGCYINTVLPQRAAAALREA
jgi:UDPglucose--hexose-1-phosphate uridylyltransferase